MKGFTLIELLIVIAIIGILSSIALRALQGGNLQEYCANHSTELKCINQK